MVQALYPRHSGSAWKFESLFSQVSSAKLGVPCKGLPDFPTPRQADQFCSYWVLLESDSAPGSSSSDTLYPVSPSWT